MTSWGGLGGVTKANPTSAIGVGGLSKLNRLAAKVVTTCARPKSSSAPALASVDRGDQASSWQRRLA
jgi:hypothetical protein